MKALAERLASDYYQEDGLMVFTEKTHIARGSCCGSGCRHCPFSPRFQAGNGELNKEILALTGREHVIMKGA